MKDFNGLAYVICLFLLCGVNSSLASAQSFTTLVNFVGANGYLPDPSLIQGRDGNLYGATSSGGNLGCPLGNGVGCGTIFMLAPSGALTSLYQFCHSTACTDGVIPGPLILATDGSFYGATSYGGGDIYTTSFGQKFCLASELPGCGTVFSLSQSGVLSTIERFDNEDGQQSSLPFVESVDGQLYGTAFYGGAGNCYDGAAYGCGAIYKLTHAGVLLLHSFCQTPQGGYCYDGFYPSAGVIQATDGSFYGTATDGGGPTGGLGTIFRVNSNGKLTTLYTFCGCGDGSSPVGLIQATDGNFYGLTSFGGVRDVGTVFKITPGGELTTLYSFCSQPQCTDGSRPGGQLVEGTDGNLYGATRDGGDVSQCSPDGCGTLFKISLSGQLTTLHAFEQADGSFPTGGLLQSTDGDFYGTSSGGGSNSDGTVFRLDVGLSPFVAFVLPAGRVGQTAEILGQGLSGTTGVSFNGTPAEFKIGSDTYLTATVPQGATTGYLTVTMPSNTLKSNLPFHVIN